MKIKQYLTEVKQPRANSYCSWCKHWTAVDHLRRKGTCDRLPRALEKMGTPKVTTITTDRNFFCPYATPNV
jgi:hypothetical protein